MFLLAKDVPGHTESYLTKQCQCIKRKKPNGVQRAPLVPIKLQYPFEIVSMDFLKFGKVQGGYEYVLVVTDHLTRYVQAYAMKNKSAKSAADKLCNSYTNFQIPTTNSS